MIAKKSRYSFKDIRKEYVFSKNRKSQIFLFLVLIVLLNPIRVFSAEKTICQTTHNNTNSVSSLSELSHNLESVSTFFTECAEVEIIDSFMEPFRVQSVALKLCGQSPKCQAYLRQQAALISGLPEEKFANHSMVQLWGDIRHYSGQFRREMPKIDDFPIQKSQQEIYDEIQKESEVKRIVTKDDQKKMACSILAAMVGPAKLKGAKVIAAEAAILSSRLATTVVRAKELEKLIKHNRIPNEVLKKFETWEKEVIAKGLDEIKKIPGYHHEPVKSKPGQFSVRLNQGYRLFYEEVIENGVKKIKALDINMHDYK